MTDSSFLNCFRVFQLQLCNALFIHLPIDKSLGCFRFKAIMKKKKAAINVCTQIFMWICIFTSFG